MRWVSTWFCDVTGDIRLCPGNDFYVRLQYSFIRVTMASGGEGNFPEYEIKCYDSEPLAASYTAELSSNSAHLKQFSDASSLRSFTF